MQENNSGREEGNERHKKVTFSPLSYYASPSFLHKKFSSPVFRVEVIFPPDESILAVVCWNIVDFSKELPQYVVKAGPIMSSMYGADWETRLEHGKFTAITGISLPSSNIAP